MTEAELLAAVSQLLELYGWTWCHFRPARTKKGWRTALSGREGFPDIVAARRGRVIFAELKVEDRELDDAQEEWRSALKGAGNCNTPGVAPCEVYVWRPAQWQDSTIERLLQ